MLVVPVTVTAGNAQATALTTSVNAKNATGTGTTSMTINQALTSAPLFFVRSGLVDYDSKLYYPGNGAFYWSRSSRDASGAHNLTIDGADAWPSGWNYRYGGFSLRCLYVPEKQKMRPKKRCHLS